MKHLKLFIVPVALAGLLALEPVGGVIGKSMPPIPVEGLAQTKAKSVDDYAGRAILIEFFAFW